VAARRACACACCRRWWSFWKNAARARRLYLSDPDYWKRLFALELDALADWSRTAGRPLITTEGWAIVDYKDWPGLDWDWVKELNAWAVGRVIASGC
jgi:hypothetical protein